MLDSPDVLKKKISRIPTAAIWVQEAKNPDECNIYNIAKLFLSSEQNKKLRKKYTSWWLSYGETKKELTWIIQDFLLPIQNIYNKLTDDFVIKLLEKNSIRANIIAEEKIHEVYKKIWFHL